MIVNVYYPAEGQLTHIATVNTPPDYDTERALGFAFRWTQNIDDSWSIYGKADHHQNVIVIAPLPVRGGRTLGHRSSMIGDIFVVDRRIFICDTFGFKEFNKEEV